VQSCQWEQQAELLVQFTEFLVGSEEISWIRLVLAVNLQDVRVVLLQVVTLLISMHGDVSNRSVLLDTVEKY
jgi:hypothetical protein